MWYGVLIALLLEVVVSQHGEFILGVEHKFGMYYLTNVLKMLCIHYCEISVLSFNTPNLISCPTILTTPRYQLVISATSLKSKKN